MTHCQQCFGGLPRTTFFSYFLKEVRWGLLLSEGMFCAHETVWETVRNELGNELRVEALGALSRAGAVPS